MTLATDQAHKLRALIVGDDPVLRIAIQQCIARLGFDTQVAENGQIGVDHFTADGADLVLLDAAMPVMDGFAACAAIRALPQGRHVPIIMITVFEDDGSVDRAFAAGADEFINKPDDQDATARLPRVTRAPHRAPLLCAEPDLPPESRAPTFGLTMPPSAGPASGLAKNSTSWEIVMQERSVDVAIIGSGTAGLNAMGQVRRAGKTFALINGGEPGTTCARVGCMPSKALIQIADDYHRRTHLGRYGVDGHQELAVDLVSVMEHVQELRDTFVDRVLGSSTDNLGDEFVQEYARFVEPTLIETDTHRIRASRVIIATGSRPLVPMAWQIFGDKVITTDSVFELNDLPASVAVVGLGTIGLELGQSLARLGVTVTGFDQLGHIGGAQDPEVQRCALDILGKEFPIHLGHPVSLTEEGAQMRVTAGEQGVLVDRVLCSIGRVPNVEGLGLDKLGVPLDRRGIPTYNPNTMQVGDLPVFIAGDVTGDRPILHEAGDEGRIAGYNAAHGETAAFKRKVPLMINFCDPNICVVGARWNDLDQATTAVGQINFAPVGRALIMGQNKGVLRVYGDKQTGVILGAEMIGPKGENLAHLLAWCIAQGLTVGQLLRMPFYHPVIEEALQAALYDLYAKVEAKNAGGLVELERLAD